MADVDNKPRPYTWLKPGVFVGCLIPVALMVVQAARGKLGADPVAIALNRLGLLALITLLASMAAWPLRLRRMLGLFAFFFALLHFLVYAVVDQGLALGAIFSDVSERKFITAGVAAFLLLIPLAVTSTHRIRR